MLKVNLVAAILCIDALSGKLTDGVQSFLRVVEVVSALISVQILRGRCGRSVALQQPWLHDTHDTQANPTLSSSKTLSYFSVNISFFSCI